MSELGFDAQRNIGEEAYNNTVDKYNKLCQNVSPRLLEDVGLAVRQAEFKGFVKDLFKMHVNTAKGYVKDLTWLIKNKRTL